MPSPVTLSEHDRFEVLVLCRRVAVELGAAALNTPSDLALPDRITLARLSLAFTAALARVEREAAPIPIPAANAADSPYRGHHHAVA